MRLSYLGIELYVLLYSLVIRDRVVCIALFSVALLTISLDLELNVTLEMLYISRHIHA